MDFQRIFILMGLAVTAYMLVLAWNQDYKQTQDLPETAVETPFETPVPGEDETVPDQHPAPMDEIAADEIPSIVPPAATKSSELPSAEATTDSSRFISVKTDVLHLRIDRQGGDIEYAALPAFPEKIDTPDKPFVLMDARNSYAAQSGLIGVNGTDTAAGRPLFASARSNYTMEGDELVVDLTFTQDTGVVITKRFRFERGDYLVKLEYLVDNRSDESWSGALFGQIKRNSEDPVMSDVNGMGLAPYVGAATFIEGAPYTKLEFDDIEETPWRESVAGGYVAMVQHYFLTAWVPDPDTTHVYRGRKLASQDLYLFEFTSPTFVVPPGAVGVESAAYYLGPKDQYRLEQISPGLDLTVDYGFLWWLAQPLFDLLFLIHSFVGNWGVAIILLTVIVKTLLYPLSAASFRSMAKMRKLQPEMARLKERYGDDRQQFSQAMMDLYKKEGANPLGGCFPILLQMPVFLALYWTLMESVELRQAPFMLWIKDLSDMDPYFVLPIAMGISMFVTQMLQPEPPDPVQAKVFKMMPIFFTFFFLWFPSGLVLYWLVNNLLSIAQQYYVTRQIEKGA